MQTVIIGRDRACDVVFSDMSVSRKHCSAEKLSDGTYFLRDLQSKNGTFVDGIRVRQKHITASSRIRLGNLNISGSDIISHLQGRMAVVRKAPGHKTPAYFIVAIAAVILLAYFLLPSKKNADTPNPAPPALQESRPGTAPRQSDFAEKMRNSEKATVIVLARLRNGNYSLGSGFFVNGHTVVTNRHVVDNASTVTVGNRIIGRYQARIIGVAKGRHKDFAALDVGRSVGTPLPFTMAAGRNEKVYAWGYPGMLVDAIKWDGLPEVVSTSGEINVIRNGESNLIVHSAKISQGNSGGPLINENGCVVGINTLLLQDNSGQYSGQYYVSYASADIISFLDSYRIKYSVR